MLPLSPREKEVLDLFDRGGSYKTIAASLGVSVHTVKSYCDRIIIKTLAESMRHAAWLRRRAEGK